jgi:hypothetical protein
LFRPVCLIRDVVYMCRSSGVWGIRRRCPCVSRAIDIIWCVCCDGGGLRGGGEIRASRFASSTMTAGMSSSRCLLLDAAPTPSLTFSFPQLFNFPSSSPVCLRVVFCFFHVMNYGCDVPAHMLSRSADRMRLCSQCTSSSLVSACLGMGACLRFRE